MVLKKVPLRLGTVPSTVELGGDIPCTKALLNILTSRMVPSFYSAAYWDTSSSCNKKR